MTVGIGNETHGPLLTQAEVDALPTGTEVVITWSGGNGPWRYTVKRDRWENVLAYTLDGFAVAFITYVGSYQSATHVSLFEKSSEE